MKQSPSRVSAKARKALIISVVIISVLAISSGLFFLLLPWAKTSQVLASDDRSSNLFALGKTTLEAAETLSDAGGEIFIDNNSSVIDGLSVLVPKEAYSQTTDYEISSTEILSHGYSDLFNPITPLINIDNGHQFANKPMTVTIPISKTDDEFAMAFYYDEETGELEGIPFIEIENDSITIITSHFSSIVVSKVVKESIIELLGKDDEIGSGFKSGFNDFQMPNIGSIICPKGHCAGQSIAAMYYYNNRDRIGWDKSLNGLFDNNEYDSTPYFIWDDAFVIRLCSVVQNKCIKWSSVSNGLHQTDDNAFYAFAYSILLTKQPQFIGIKSTSSGHAMIVYNVSSDALYISDPNFPGDTRKISYKIVNGLVDLQPYFSGDDCEQATTNSKEYTDFNYFGLYSLIDKSKVAEVWNKVQNDKDPGTSAFPADVSFTVRIVKDQEKNEYYEIPLEDGMAVYQSQISEIGKRLLYIYPSGTYKAGDKFYFYIGESDKYFGFLEKANTGIPFDLNNLVMGNNDIGIRYMREVSVTKDGQTKTIEKFVNFYRFNIIVKADPMLSVSPETANAFVGDIIPFSATVDNMPDDAVYIWDFGDDNIIATNDSDYPYAYMAEGAYSGEVSIVNEDSLAVLATTYFSVVVSPTAPEPGQEYTDFPEELIGTWHLVGNAKKTGSDSPEIFAYDPNYSGGYRFTFDDNGQLVDSDGRQYDYNILSGSMWVKYRVLESSQESDSKDGLLYGYDGRFYALDNWIDEDGVIVDYYFVYEKTE